MVFELETTPASRERASHMETVVFADWQRWFRQGRKRLPAVAVRHGEALPETWERLVASPATVLLESAQGGRFTYLCDRPERVILGREDGAEIWSPEGKTRLAERSGKPLELLRTLQAEAGAPALAGWPEMTGGFIGVLAYDIVHTWERLSRRARRDLDVPLYAMIEPRELFIHDQIERTLGVVVWRDAPPDESTLAEAFRAATAAAESACDRWRRDGRRAETAPEVAAVAAEMGHIAPPEPSFSSEAFQSAVRHAKEYIAAGDTYQVNLSLRSSRAVAIAPAAIYESLRRVNPSPYMGFLRLPAFALVCGSPELLVRLADGHLSSRPIAGTRPRGVAAPQDQDFSVELSANEKERAEHLMLVDLVRNDIGRVAEYGSVRVPEFMAVERYSHVMHLVSQVEGRLASGRTWVDTFQAMFPGGTITGCPKIRTMEIIEELEPVGRGYYTGALGWISYAGDMEMNIVIRSMLVQHGVAHVQAGAGIVADSDPVRELDESRRKAKALWVALDRAEGKSHG